MCACQEVSWFLLCLFDCFMCVALGIKPRVFSLSYILAFPNSLYFFIVLNFCNWVLLSHLIVHAGLELAIVLLQPPIMLWLHLCTPCLASLWFSEPSSGNICANPPFLGHIWHLTSLSSLMALFHLADLAKWHVICFYMSP